MTKVVAFDNDDTIVVRWSYHPADKDRVIIIEQGNDLVAIDRKYVDGLIAALANMEV
jgi:hypothetical protein